MFVLCPNNNYGFCKYGRICEKIHLTEICKQNENCKEYFGVIKDTHTHVHTLKDMEGVNLVHSVPLFMKKFKKCCSKKK